MMYKSEYALPQLFIDGSARREVIRPRDLALQASAKPSNCGSGGAMMFRWSYTKAPGPEVMWPELDEKTKTTRSLRIRKNTLVVYQSYTLRVWGKMEADPPNMAVEALVTLDVVPATLVAQIAGGDRALPTIEPLVLDATSSIDPDNSSIPFNYNWTCVTIPDLNPCENKLEERVTMPSGPVGAFTIPPRTFRINLQIQITVKVAKPGTGMLPDSATVNIDILPAGPPKVMILPLTKKKQNANEKIVLKGGIEEDYRTVQFKWSTLEKDLIDFDLEALHPTNEDEFRDSSTGPNGQNLVIKANMLSAGVHYKFQLTAEDGFGGPGRGSIKVLMNTPPSGGEFIVEPMEGLAVETDFTLKVHTCSVCMQAESLWW